MNINEGRSGAHDWERNGASLVLIQYLEIHTNYKIHNSAHEVLPLCNNQVPCNTYHAIIIA
jgi:hypothetical protein